MEDSENKTFKSLVPQATSKYDSELGMIHEEPTPYMNLNENF
jgi:hypothetical protein